MNQRVTTLCLCAVLTAVSPTATAAEPAAPTPAATCGRGHGSAMAEIACEIRHSLDDLPPGALVVAAPLPAEPSVKNPAGLTARLSNVVAGALGARASDEAAKLARARTLASDAGTLVHLTPNLSHGDLQVAVDVYRVPKSFWDRVRDPEPSPSQHTFARRKLDAELRTFLPPVPLVAQHIDKAPTSEPDPVAVACGDANGDGAQEIVLVGRHRIQLGRIRSGRLLSSRPARKRAIVPASSAIRSASASTRHARTRSQRCWK